MNLTTEFLTNVRRIGKLHERMLREICEEYGLSLTEATVVSFLHNNPGYDTAADIAELTRFVRLPDGPGRQRIEEMSKAVIRMVTDSVDSFVKRDLELAREVCREDDQVDDLFNQVKKELIGLIAADADSGELWLDLIMVAKYLERIGDHATNVAEWVEYSITGNHPSNN